MHIDTNKLLVAMGENGFNIKKLSYISGVSRQTLSYIKAGKACTPVTAGKIAKALSLPLKDLVEQ